MMFSKRQFRIIQGIMARVTPSVAPAPKAAVLANASAGRGDSGFIRSATVTAMKFPNSLRWPPQAAVVLLISTLIVSASSDSAWSQQAAESDATQAAEQLTGNEPAPETPDKVDVKPVARDEEISSRLTDILVSSKRFTAPEVDVENGVVFMSGDALEPEFRQWAGDLAAKTQDVVAVVNRMSIREKSIWDFSAAFAELRDFRKSAIQAIPILIFGLGVILITWLLAKLASFTATRLLARRVPNNLLRWVLSKAVAIPILIFGVYLVLRISGLTQLALTVLGGTGLIGLVIGIAFQDIAENFLASVLISVQKPFRVGDIVQVEGHEGMVQRVTTRGTTLMTLDGNMVQVPNSQIYKSTIVNYTANPMRRVSFDIGIGYDDSTTEAQRIILDQIKKHESTLNDPAPRVLIDSLTSATVNLRVLFWVNGKLHDARSVRSSLMRISKQALQKKGISLPDESREVIFPNGVPVFMKDSSESEPASTSAQAVGSTGGQPSSESLSQSQSEANPVCAIAILQQPEEQAISEAEGGLKSEEADIKKQAGNSWLPGEGAEVLVSADEDE